MEKKEILKKSFNGIEFNFYPAYNYESAKIGGKIYNTNERSSEFVDGITVIYKQGDKTHYRLYRKRRGGEYFIFILNIDTKLHIVKTYISPCTKDDYYEIICSKEVSGRTISNERALDIARQYYEYKMMNSDCFYDFLWKKKYMTEEEYKNTGNKKYTQYLFDKMYW